MVEDYRRFFFMILIFSRSEPICVSKEIILSTYVLNNLACWQDDECDYKHLWKKPWMTADSLDYHFKMSAKHLDWKEQLYQDGILGRRIFLLLVHRGLENIIELTGLKKTLCIQLLWNSKYINKRYQYKKHEIMWGYKPVFLKKRQK